MRNNGLIEAVLRLGKLVLQFGRIKRLCVHDDGITRESDTDHTVMLGLIACAYAQKVAPHLDIGRIAQFSLVHDLVEVYAGDTITIGHDQSVISEKNERERQALARIKQEFDDEFPWISVTIEEYESLASPEARFVKTLDKGMPSISHTLNKGLVLRDIGHTKESLIKIRSKEQDPATHQYTLDQPEAVTLRNALMDMVVEKYDSARK